MRPVLVMHLANAQALAVDAGFGAQHTVNQLLLAHFQAEESYTARFAADDFVRTQRYVLHNVQRQRSFTHGRTRRQNNKIGRVQAARQLIQICKACRQTGKAALVLQQAFNALHAVHQDIINRCKIRLFLTVGNFQDAAFGCIQQRADIIVGLVAHSRNFGRNTHKLAQNRLFSNNLRMVLNVSCRQHNIRQTGDVGNAANILQLVVTLENFCHSNHIYCFILIVKLQHSTKDNTMRLAVKVICRQQFRRLSDSLFVNQHSTEHSLLRFYILRWHSFFNHSLLPPVSNLFIHIIIHYLLQS